MNITENSFDDNLTEQQSYSNRNELGSFLSTCIFNSELSLCIDSSVCSESSIIMQQSSTLERIIFFTFLKVGNEDHSTQSDVEDDSTIQEDSQSTNQPGREIDCIFWKRRLFIDDNRKMNNVLEIWRKQYFSDCQLFWYGSYKYAFHFGAYNISYMDALQKQWDSDKNNMIPGTFKHPKMTEDDNTSSFAQLKSIRKSTQNYFATLPQSRSTIFAPHNAPIGYISVYPPENDEITDRDVSLVLHYDGKPSTPYSTVADDYLIFSIRVLNCNSWDIHDGPFVQPVLILPKPKIGDLNKNSQEYKVKSKSLHEYVMGVVDAIMLDSSFLGLNGVYVKVGENQWDHVMWGFNNLSGDTVAQCQMIGSPGKQASSYQCLYNVLCKFDKYRKETRSFVDLCTQIDSADSLDRSRLHAIRQCNITSATAHLSIIGGQKLNTDETPIQYPLKEKYTYLNDNFISDATNIQSVLRHFYPSGTLFFYPPTPFHPSLRQSIKRILMGNLFSKNVILHITPIIQTSIAFTATENEYNPKTLEYRENNNSVEWTDSIHNCSSITLDDFKLENIPISPEYNSHISEINYAAGATDPIKISSQLRILSNLMLVPFSSILSVDAMHNYYHIVEWAIHMICKKELRPEELTGLYPDFFQSLSINPEDTSLSIPQEVQEQANQLCSELPKSLKIPEFKYGMLSGKSMDTAFKLGNTYFPTLLRKSRYNNLFSFCIREILNLYNILFMKRASLLTLIGSHNVYILLWSILEGKMQPNMFTPSLHSSLHLLDSNLACGPMIYYVNFYLEYLYGIIANNLIPSPNTVLTCMKRINTLYRLVNLIGNSNGIPIKAYIANAVEPLTLRVQPPKVQAILEGIRNITEANAIDDWGFARVEELFRTTYLDHYKCDNQSAEQYIKEKKPQNFDVKIEKCSSRLFRVCRWRDGHLYFSIFPESNLSSEFLKKNEKCITYTADENGDLKLYLICGYFTALANGIPYISALCLEIPYMRDHYVSATHYVQLYDSLFNREQNWKVISLYRLHLNDLTIGKEDSNYVVHINSKVYSQCHNMVNAWEFYHKDQRANIINMWDIGLTYSLSNIDNTNRELAKHSTASPAEFAIKLDYPKMIEQTRKYYLNHT